MYQDLLSPGLYSTFCTEAIFSSCAILLAKNYYTVVQQPTPHLPNPTVFDVNISFRPNKKMATCIFQSLVIIHTQLTVRNWLV